jgi:hypothetical protein
MTAVCQKGNGFILVLERLPGINIASPPSKAVINTAVGL